MGFLNNLFSKNKNEEEPEVEEVYNVEHDGIVGAAEMTAAIVASGVEKGDFSKINEKLDDLPVETTSKQQYVFPVQKHGAEYAFTIFSLIMIAVFLYFTVISAGIVFYSKEFINYGLVGLVASIFIIFLNVSFIRAIVSRMKFYARYAEYEPIIRYKSVELVEDIATFANVKEALVIKDLNKAIKKGYIPEGHFGKNNMIFMVSDMTNEQYLEKQAVYDRYYRKLLEERHRMGERSKEIQRILDEGNEYVSRIKESNAVIKDKSVSEKLYRMEEIVSMIFHEVDVNPKQSEKLGLLLSYYLPTTEKLLDSYIELGDSKKGSAPVRRVREEIEKSLDKINNCFEGILEQFYEEKELDIVSDISAMETIMQQENL